MVVGLLAQTRMLKAVFALAQSEADDVRLAVVAGVDKVTRVAAADQMLCTA